MYWLLFLKKILVFLINLVIFLSLHFNAFLLVPFIFWIKILLEVRSPLMKLPSQSRDGLHLCRPVQFALFAMGSFNPKQREASRAVTPN